MNDSTAQIPRPWLKAVQFLNCFCFLGVLAIWLRGRLPFYIGEMSVLVGFIANSIVFCLVPKQRPIAIFLGLLYGLHLIVWLGYFVWLRSH